MKKLANKILYSFLALAMVITCFTACGDKKDSTALVFDEKDPLKYYQSVEVKSIDYTAQKIDDTLNKLSSISEIAEMAVNSSATIKINPEFFPEFLNTELPFDLKSLKINGTMNFKQDKGFNILGDISLNDKNILNIDTIFDQAKNTLFLKIPELTSNNLYVSLKDIEDKISTAEEGIDGLDEQDNLFSISKMDYNALKDIDTKDIIELYKKYGTILINATEKVDIENDATLDVNGQTVNCKKIISTLTEEQAKKALDEICTELKKDETVNKILKGYGITNDEFNTSVDEFCKELKSDDENDADLIIEVYINEDNEIIGRKFYTKDDESNYFKYGIIKSENGKSLTDISFVDEEEKFNVVIDSTTTDGASSGTATISNDDEKYVITFNDVSFSEDKIVGEFSFDLTDVAEVPCVLRLKFDVTSEKQGLTLAFEKNDKEYITVEFNSENTKFTDFDIPEIDPEKDYNINDENSMMLFVQEAQTNVVTILDKIATALGTDMETLMQIFG